MSLPGNKKAKSALNPTPSHARVSASSSSSSSSSSINQAAFTADGEHSEGDASAAEEFEHSIRALGRTVEPDAKKRATSRKIARQGAWPCSAEESAANPGYYVRRPGHQYTMPRHPQGQSAGYCQELCHAFICLRLAGYSVMQTITALKSDLIQGKLPEWNRLKKSLGRIEVEGQLAQAGTMSLISISKSIFELIALADHPPFGVPADAKRMAIYPINAAQPTHDIVLFEQIVGKFPKMQRDYYKVDSDHNVTHAEGASAVKNRPVLKRPRDFPTFQHALFSWIEASRQRTVVHPQNPDRNLIRIPTSFALVSFYSSTSGHMCAVDFSDPKSIGIFDPNHGWMEPEQGFCTLSLEKALTILWETYADQESSKKYDKEAKMGAACIDADGVNIWAYSAQIHLQAAPRSASPLRSMSSSHSSTSSLQRPPSPMSPGSPLPVVRPQSTGSNSPPAIGLLKRRGSEEWE